MSDRSLRHVTKENVTTMLDPFDELCNEYAEDLQTNNGKPSVNPVFPD